MSTTRATDPQFSGYVRKDAREAFQRYAADLRVSCAAIVNLLMRRVIEREALPQLVPRDDQVGSPRDAKLTIRIANGRLLDDFSKFAEKAGMTVSEAMSLLVEVEIDEQWLRSSVGCPTRFESNEAK